MSLLWCAIVGMSFLLGAAGICVEDVTGVILEGPQNATVFENETAVFSCVTEDTEELDWDINETDAELFNPNFNFTTRPLQNGSMELVQYLFFLPAVAELNNSLIRCTIYIGAEVSNELCSDNARLTIKENSDIEEVQGGGLEVNDTQTVSPTSVASASTSLTNNEFVSILAGVTSVFVLLLLLMVVALGMVVVWHRKNRKPQQRQLTEDCTGKEDVDCPSQDKVTRDSVNDKIEMQDNPVYGVNDRIEMQSNPVYGVNDRNEAKSNPVSRVNSSNELQINPVYEDDDSNELQNNPIYGVNDRIEMQSNPVYGVNDRNEIKSNPVSRVNSSNELQINPVYEDDDSNELQNNPIYGVNTGNVVQPNPVTEVNDMCYNPAYEDFNRIEMQLNPVYGVNNTTEVQQPQPKAKVSGLSIKTLV